jgi:hypothetical protein
MLPIKKSDQHSLIIYFEHLHFHFYFLVGLLVECMYCLLLILLVACFCILISSLACLWLFLLYLTSMLGCRIDLDLPCLCDHWLSC